MRLALVREQIVEIEKARIERLVHAPDTGPHAMVRLLAKVIGIAIETADMLVQEVLSRNLRDRRAVARYAGLTGSPDESGTKRGEKGLAKAGNARVRRIDPTRLALSAIPETKHAGEMVPLTNRRAERRTQDDDDRCTGAQAADCALADGHDRRSAGRRGVAAGPSRRDLKARDKVRSLLRLRGANSLKPFIRPSRCRNG